MDLREFVIRYVLARASNTNQSAGELTTSIREAIQAYVAVDAVAPIQEGRATADATPATVSSVSSGGSRAKAPK